MVASDQNFRPSSARRKSLREADSYEAPVVSGFFPLERYTSAAEKLLENFERSLNSNELDDAFVYGFRYCIFCVEGVLKHDYIDRPSNSAQKSKLSRQVTSVLTNMEKISALMDEEEIEKERVRKERLEKERLEQERRQQEEQERLIANFAARMNALKVPAAASASAGTTDSSSSLPPGTTLSVEQSAFAKLQKLASMQNGQQSSQSLPEVAPSSSRPNSNGGSRTSDSAIDLSQLQPVPPPNAEDIDSDQDEDDDEENTGDNGGMPPPPPSYNQASTLRQSSYFGPGRDAHGKNDQKKSVSFSATNHVKLIPPNNKHNREAGPPSYDQAASTSSKKSKKKKKRKPNINQVVVQANREYQQYSQAGKIQVSPLGTYQGRVGGSTNGCTVISALCAAMHLETKTGLLTPQANRVIDEGCVPLLRKIRSKLQLGGSSLIIPSDVHDHLVDEKILFQHKFVGAAGGNILDSEHVETVLTYLHTANGDHKATGQFSPRKAAATLFFKEHVVSIVKFPISPTDAAYDLIDSMPRGNTGVGSRTRCHGIAALRVLLQSYACAKFSSSNIQYISSHPWDESMADFDPRVFQAFVWSDLPMPKQ